MRTVFLCLAVALCVRAKEEEVFRYDDEETKQSQYMVGQPGAAVKGGWKFLSPEGKSLELTYTADERGFQPQAEYIPVPVQDTNEVAKAKSLFYSMYEKAKAKAEQAEKQAEDLNTEEEAEAKVVEIAARKKRHSYHRRPHFRPYYSKPYLRPHYKKPYFWPYPSQYYHHVKANQDEVLYKYEPKVGFVPVKTDMMDTEDTEGEGEKEVLYKFKPYYGFVPVNKDMMAAEGQSEEEDMLDKQSEKQVLYKYKPYVGFVPVNGDMMYKDDSTMMEEKLYKHHPYFGFTPVDEGHGPDTRYTYSAINGFTKVEKSDNEDMGDMEEYTFDPFYGFKPVGKESDKERDYVYKPYRGFVPVSKKEDKKEEDMMDKEDMMTYKYSPFYGYVPAKSPFIEKKSQLDDKMYKFVPYVGFVPVKEEMMIDMGDMMSDDKMMMDMGDMKSDDKMMMDMGDMMSDDKMMMDMMSDDEIGLRMASEDIMNEDDAIARKRRSPEGTDMMGSIAKPVTYSAWPQTYNPYVYAQPYIRPTPYYYQPGYYQGGYTPSSTFLLPNQQYYQHTFLAPYVQVVPTALPGSIPMPGENPEGMGMIMDMAGGGEPTKRNQIVSSDEEKPVNPTPEIESPLSVPGEVETPLPMDFPVFPDTEETEEQGALLF